MVTLMDPNDPQEERVFLALGPIRDSAAVMITWRETPRASSIMVSSFEAHF